MKGSPEGGAHQGGGPGGVDPALGTWSAESSRDPGITALLRSAPALTKPEGQGGGGSPGPAKPSLGSAHTRTRCLVKILPYFLVTWAVEKHDEKPGSRYVTFQVLLDSPASSPEIICGGI